MLDLNKGSKWNSDESTNKNVDELKLITSSASLAKSTIINDYHLLAIELQQLLNDLVKECKMKGADHDALHLWLEPLMQDIKNMEKVSEIHEAQVIYNKVIERLNIYNTYFEKK